MSGPQQPNLTERLRRYCTDRGDRTAVALAGQGGAVVARLTGTEWNDRASALAAHLRPDTRALLLLPGSLEFCVALSGVLYAGACAVPTPLPGDGQAQFVEIGRDAEIDVIITDAATAPAARQLWAERDAGPVSWIVLDVAQPEPVPDWTPPTIEPGTLAVLQYSSGSTGAPKAVEVSHRLLCTWLDELAGRVALPPGSSVVNWVPVHHVLGLNLLLMGSRLDGPVTLLTPEDALAEPRGWLRAISEADSGVLSGAPPFGYQRCTEDIAEPDRVGLDLSRWAVAIVGSERIRSSVLDSFAEAFGPCGFTSSAFFTAYGTTEIMMGSGGCRPDGPARMHVDTEALERGRIEHATPGERTTELIPCGRPASRAELLIVDPEQRTECAPGEIGELWIRGDIVACGYWRRPRQTAETFGARLADGTGPFLRTGDLAFFHDGELVICGRLSEIIIVRGRNLLPHDVEQSAQRCAPELAAGPAAAFAIDGEDGEQLVVLVSAAPDTPTAPDELAATARRAVIAEQEIDPHEVVVLPPDRIPLTSTGKVQRAACRRAYLAGEFDPLGAVGAYAGGSARASAARTPLDAVRDRIASLLGTPTDAIDPDTPLVELGLDSMRLIKLRGVLARELGLSVPIHELGGTDTRALSLRASADGVAGPQRDGTRITPAPEARGEPFPLTELQHAYLVGRSGGYALGGVGTHFYGEFDSAGLDPDRLHRAWCRVVERHGALRSVISADGTQRVLPDPEIPPMAVLDLREATEEQAAKHVELTRGEMAVQTFDADAWPPFDIRVSRLPGGLDRVHVSLDLLVLDLWSLHIVSREWQACYTDPEVELPELALTFRDYVLHEDGDPAHAERSRKYWMDRLATLPPGPELPLARPPSGLGRPPKYVRRQARVDGDRWQRIVRRARSAGVTTSAVLIAAYATVLGTFGQRGRFTLNLPTFNRAPVHPEVDALVGDFTSVTLLEVDLGAARDFADLARQVQRRLWQDLEHSAFSGVRLLRELGRARGGEAEIFAPVVFASASGQSDRTGEPMPLSWLGDRAFGLSQTPQVLLDHQLFEDPDGLDFNWDAVDELFVEGTLDAMFGSYRTVLDELSATGDDSWSEPLDTLLENPDHALVARANDTGGVVPDGLLHDGVLDQATRRPEAKAVLAADAELTFAELAAHAGALAHRLRELGAGPGDVVGVSLTKSAAQVVAAVGVTLSGAAYLPIDPELPPARQNLLLSRGECGLVVAGEHRASWPDGVGVVRVELDADPGTVAPPVTPARPTDPAYVIFTSGSTGEPKGVVCSHRAALNTCVDINQRFDVTPQDRVLGLSSLSFDLSVWDIYGVLAAGGTLVLPEPQDRRDPARWLELVRAHGVTIWNSVPALARMFTDYTHGAAEPVPLRLVLMSGDWIPVDLPDRIRSIAPEARVVSLGGATEAAIWSVCYEIDEVDPAWESIPYGTPLRNQTLSVLDDRWRECPVHVSGELFIGGAGLADGYFGDPDKTATRFVTHPRTGERLYRTGDLGRWRPDGTIEFLGRADFQVKIGGYRIELGEIESTLLAHEDVDAAVVTALGDRHGKRLAACVVPSGLRSEPTTEEMFGSGVLAGGLERMDFTLARNGVRTDLDTAVDPPCDPVSLTAASDGVLSRASHRRFAARPVTLAELSALLAPLRSHAGESLPKYAYASAGNSYGVQTYLWVRHGQVEGLAGGTYYHDPSAHRLVPIDEHELTGSVGFGVDAEAVGTAAFAVFLVADLAAVRPLYGVRARDFCLIETGLMTQLLDEHAPSHGIGLCQVGTHDPAGALREAFRLGAEHEPLHAVLGGALLPAGAEPATTGQRTERDLVEDLRDHLGRNLPEYMVPATLVVTERLPLTPVGKVDRSAVERMVTPTEHQLDDSPPAGTLERTIASVFRRVLDVDVIGVHSRFFDLGADSAAIVRAYRWLRTELDVDFPLVRMFEHATVRRLAEALSRDDDLETDELIDKATARARMRRVARPPRGQERTAVAGEGRTRS
ncbi:hypothetical protein B1813_00790 [Saccharomonospora piscinae]|uniref:Phenyloxazoline synthase MbtB n=1 Tax=Saccharomonospora piscinae TaxID=687388 RepID=A0A1V9ACB2_SACPI|nr:non-ribosomal peptide synthetase [Saccharomonospora piscinae]OQO94676.1 hypothetical protein B1813_00790 [Saccharomonospora piscinae]